MASDPSQQQASAIPVIAASPSKVSAKIAATPKTEAAGNTSTGAVDPTGPAIAAALSTITTPTTDATKSNAHALPTEDGENKSSSSAFPSLATSADVATTKSITTDRAASAASAQDSPASDAASPFEQIVLGLRGKLDAKNGKAEIRLDPPNLGTVRVSVNLQNGSLTAQFQSSSQVVRDLLQSNMEKLKTTLESQGITVDKLAVDSSGAKVPAPVSVAALPTDAAANDGRSAGQYYSSGGGQKRSAKEPGQFSKVWRDVADAAPVDLVA